ncbi:MAG: hypothetical protein ABH836_05370 [Candidatus Omnitrophota bacterium]
MKVNKFCILIFLAVLFLPFCYAVAEEKQEPIIFDGDKIEYSDEYKIIHGWGNVIMRYKDTTMTADKMSFDTENQEATAEGDVSLYKDDTVFRGKYGHYDLKTEKGFVRDVKFSSAFVYGGAEEVNKTDKETFVGKQGYFGTCPFKKPHYRLQTKRLNIYLHDKVVAHNVIFFIGDVPFLYLPYYSYSLKDNRPRVTVMPGKSKEWGFYVLTGWRYRFDDDSMGRIHLDWRENMGPAEGFTHKYKTKDLGEGTFHGYYMQERLRDLPEGTPAEFERYRIKWVHEWEPDLNTRTFAEYHNQSDINFNKDYFYTEYVKDPQPKTQFSFTKKSPYYSVNFYSRVRVNQFETVTQSMPEVSFNLPGYQLGHTKFYYTNETKFANFNKKTANAGMVGGNAYFFTTDTNTVRVDTYNKLTYPTKLPGYFKWLNTTPYVDVRETFYTRDKDGANRDFLRNIYGAGYNLNTRIFRIFDAEKDFLGIKINRLRHLVTPNIDYGYVHDPTVPADTLETFDTIDTLSTGKAYTFRLNNKLQTKWVDGEGNPETVNLVDFDSWVYLYPQREERSFSDIFLSLKIVPFRWLESTSSTTYNWVTGDFEVFNMGLDINQPKWQVEAAHRFLTNNYSESSFKALYHLTSKWQVGFYERYDFTKKRLNEQEYFIGRDVHDWIIELTWNMENPGGESLMFVFRNKSFPEAPLGFETSYHEPKTGSQSEPIY